jgi:DNA-binding CsgD family transcriptional regulator
VCPNSIGPKGKGTAEVKSEVAGKHAGERGRHMEDTKVQLGPRERQIAELLLQGCDNEEIARQLNMARRTVKAHFNRLFLRFGITHGIKRVQLATLLYRRQLCLQPNATETVFPLNANTASLNSLPKDSRIATSPTKSEPRNTSSKTTSGSSMTNSDSGTALNSRSGTKLAAPNSLKPDDFAHWDSSGRSSRRLPVTH